MMYLYRYVFNIVESVQQDSKKDKAVQTRRCQTSVGGLGMEFALPAKSVKNVLNDFRILMVNTVLSSFTDI